MVKRFVVECQSRSAAEFGTMRRGNLNRLVTEGSKWLTPLWNGVVWATIALSWGSLGLGFAMSDEVRNAMVDGSPARDEWIMRHLASDQAKEPFSFVYRGRQSRDVLAVWPSHREIIRLDKSRSQTTLTWADPQSGLEVRCVSVVYSDFPAVEWTVYFKNKGKENSPILQDVQGIDVVFRRGASGEFVLNGIQGDWTAAESYQPYCVPLSPGAQRKFAPSQHLGKSTSGPEGWPYFNLQMPEGGVMLAVGWPGQWASSFTRTASRSLRVVAGQAQTHLYLKPGEEIRTPLTALLFWKGQDIVSAQNLWRRWFIAHNMPRIDGRVQQPITQVQVGGSEQNIKDVAAFLKAGIQPDVCWRDAGWYPSDRGPFDGELSWLNTGTWEIDPVRYPKGFKPFSDWVHSQGMQFLLWFEPERVGDPKSWLPTNHADWVLPCNAQGGMLNEGDPAARAWLINHVDKLIKSQGIDWYREDMNGDGPHPGWRMNDSADRVGITENLYIQGHLEFWDELRRRNPRLRIDSCASGGRRNDLETMRRAVPLTRSDFQFAYMEGVVEGNQGHTYGISSWLPFYGSGCYFYDQYSYRSFYMPLFGMGKLTPDNTAAQRHAYAECRRVAPFMLGDFYPLTPYSLKLSDWIAWQFDRPESSDGMVQAFRRSQNSESQVRFKLRGLTPDSQYEVINLDTEVTEIAIGRDLMNKGLPVVIDTQPGSAIYVYQLAKSATSFKDQ